jgi:hypothetical protein
MRSSDADSMRRESAADEESEVVGVAAAAADAIIVTWMRDVNTRIACQANIVTVLRSHLEL